MNDKRKKIIIISACIVAAIILVIIVLSNISVEKNDESNNVIIPEEEISDTQLRETTIELYFLDKDNKLASNIRKIDAKELLDDPYETVLINLFNGINDDSLNTAIPKNTKIKGINREGDSIVIDLSKDFIDSNMEDENKIKLAINQIVYTVTQFTEINKVKIIIEGEESEFIGNQEFCRE